MVVVSYELEEHVAIITLNRPEHMNTFNPAMYREFNSCMSRFREDDKAWVALIAANGDRAFSAGVDIKSLDAEISTASEEQLPALLSEFSIDLQDEYFCDKPIIAAIQGFCIGEGLSLALGCDLRIAGEGASFALPESKIGIPTVNASIHGARIIGPSNILELLLMGEPRDAQWAYRTGLINRVVPDADVFSAGRDWADKVAALSPMANWIAKEAAVRSRYRSFGETVEIAAARRDALFTSHDFREGRRAFIEKRKPNFICA